MSICTQSAAQVHVCSALSACGGLASIMTAACHSVLSASAAAHTLCHILRMHAPAGEDGGPLAGLGEALRGLPDLERGITRLLHRTASPSEFLTVLQALSSLAQRLQVQVPCAAAKITVSCAPETVQLHHAHSLSAPGIG